jgi:hypothetical protein
VDFDEVLLAAEVKVRDGTLERTGEATEQLLADSQVVVPYQEGDLSRAGYAQTRDTGAGAEGIVKFDSVYARYQELTEDLQHQDQGQAHYLGGTLRANSVRYIDHISKVMDDLG